MELALRHREESGHLAPRSPDELRDSLLAGALGPGSPPRRELDIPQEVRDLRVIITDRDARTKWSYP